MSGLQLFEVAKKYCYSKGDGDAATIPHLSPPQTTKLFEPTVAKIELGLQRHKMQSWAVRDCWSQRWCYAVVSSPHTADSRAAQQAQCKPCKIPDMTYSCARIFRAL